MIEDIDRDVFIRVQTDLLVVGDSIMTDRHHASNGNYEDNDPQSQVGGIIPAFPLSGRLRHGMERVVHEYGGTVCHPGESNANFMKEDVYERDLDDGYHEKGVLKHNHQMPITKASEEVLKEIRLSLYHAHLPKLAAEGLIHYDSERQRVEPTDQFEQVQPMLSTLLAADPTLEAPIKL